MVVHAQKTKPGALLVGRRPLLANGGIPRCEPAKHVLPIIRRLRGYAQLAGWLANPRRPLYIHLLFVGMIMILQIYIHPMEAG
jgi:hypothetical protein